MTFINSSFLFLFKDNLLHCLKMLNNVTLSRNSFEHFPTGPPKQLAAVQVGLSLNSSCFLVFVTCFKGFYYRFCTNEKKVHLQVDCKQSLFSSKIRGKEHKTSKRASLTVSVTWER